MILDLDGSFCFHSITCLSFFISCQWYVYFSWIVVKFLVNFLDLYSSFSFMHQIQTVKPWPEPAKNHHIKRYLYKTTIFFFLENKYGWYSDWLELYKSNHDDQYSVTDIITFLVFSSKTCW